MRSRAAAKRQRSLGSWARFLVVALGLIPRSGEAAEATAAVREFYLIVNAEQGREVEQQSTLEGAEARIRRLGTGRYRITFPGGGRPESYPFVVQLMWRDRAP
jgi:hypothetical protein